MLPIVASTTPSEQASGLVLGTSNSSSKKRARATNNDPPSKSPRLTASAESPATLQAELDEYDQDLSKPTETQHSCTEAHATGLSRELEPQLAFFSDVSSPELDNSSSNRTFIANSFYGLLYANPTTFWHTRIMVWFFVEFRGLFSSSAKSTSSSWSVPANIDVENSSYDDLQAIHDSAIVPHSAEPSFIGLTPTYRRLNPLSLDDMKHIFTRRGKRWKCPLCEKTLANRNPEYLQRHLLMQHWDEVAQWLIPDESQRDFDVDLASMLIACGIPMNQVDAGPFRAFLNKYVPHRVPYVKYRTILLLHR